MLLFYILLSLKFYFRPNNENPFGGKLAFEGLEFYFINFYLWDQESSQLGMPPSYNGGF